MVTMWYEKLFIVIIYFLINKNTYVQYYKQQILGSKMMKQCVVIYVNPCLIIHNLRLKEYGQSHSIPKNIIMDGDLYFLCFVLNESAHFHSEKCTF